MKIRRKLLLSYLLIVALFVAAGAAMTYNTMKIAEIQNNVKLQTEINSNAYAYQQGLDQKQLGTFAYSSGNSTVGEQVIVNAAKTIVDAENYLVNALANDPALLGKFQEVQDIDNTQINDAITQVVGIYSGNDSNKFVLMWNQLNRLMISTTDADAKLANVRATTLSNVQNATAQSQNYASFSTIIAIASIIGIGVVSVALAFVMGNRITGPLKKLADIAHKVSLGDLNQRYYLKENIDIKTGDEIDELVGAFRRMINAFRMTEALSSEENETEGTDKQ
jgi:HAMP domain-containing protein